MLTGCPELSPTRLSGVHARHVPVDLTENARFRQTLLRDCKGDRALRRRVKRACAEDLLFYLRTFGWTYDPRTPQKPKVFVPYPFQEKALKAILQAVEHQHELVIEKSRDMGATWMCLYAMEYLWHFHPWFSFLFVSRKEDMVDKPGDPDTLFWKIDFAHRFLPRWLMPEGYDPTPGGPHRRRRHFENPETSSTMDGDSTTGAVGVGGRRTAIFLDEFSRMEDANLVYAGTADTADCRIFNFTPFGTGNAAYRLSQHPSIKKLRMHWSEHPVKARGLYHYDRCSKKLIVDDVAYDFPHDYEFIQDGKLRSVWYDVQWRDRRSPAEIAQMLDIDYQGSVTEFFHGETINVLQEAYCRDPDWEGDIRFHPDTCNPIPDAALEKFDGGPLRLWFTPDARGRVPLAKYAVGADLSTGVGSTASILCLGDARTGQKVAEYASAHVLPHDMAKRAVALCRLFRSEESYARLCWEAQGPGVGFGKKVMELRFGNVYFRTYEARTVHKPTDTPGWVPTEENKLRLLEDYRSALSSRQFLNPSYLALQECRRFKFNDNGVPEYEETDAINVTTGRPDPSGARKNHGDRVIADALCYKMMVEIMGTSPQAPSVPKPPPMSIAARMQAAGAEEEDAPWWMR